MASYSNSLGKWLKYKKTLRSMTMRPQMLNFFPEKDLRNYLVLPSWVFFVIFLFYFFFGSSNWHFGEFLIQSKHIHCIYFFVGQEKGSPSSSGFFSQQSLSDFQLFVPFMHLYFSFWKFNLINTRVCISEVDFKSTSWYSVIQLENASTHCHKYF